MFAPGAIASASTASFCSTLKRRRRSTRPSSSAVAYDIDLALLLDPVPRQHPASSSRRSQGGRHRRDTYRARLGKCYRLIDRERDYHGSPAFSSRWYSVPFRKFQSISVQRGESDEVRGAESATGRC